MTISLRRFSPLAALRSISTRRSSLVVVCAVVVSAALLGSAGPALAVVTTVESKTVGLQPRQSEFMFAGRTVEDELGKLFYFASPESFANAAGNPVLHKTETFVVYWDPADRYHGDWQHLIDLFLHDVGSDSGTLNNVFAVDAQYTDKTNVPAYYRVTSRTAYTDTEKYPASGCTDPDPLEEYKPYKTAPLSCLTDQQVREQLQTFIAQHGLPKGMNAVYYLLTPPGVTVCLDSTATHCSDYEATPESYENSFCSYHSAINPDETPVGDGNTVLYATIPWTAGGLGDGQLSGADRKSAYDCQDGAFDPSSDPIEEKEHPKERTETKKEFEEKTLEAQQAVEEEIALEGPHQQEPNQPSSCPSPDGFCDTGLADLIINQIAVEQQNIVTNPLLNAWHDAANNEVTDECRNFFETGKLEGSSGALPKSFAGTLSNQQIGAGTYYLNMTFNLAGLKLVYPGHACRGNVNLVPQFTAPNPVNSGETVGFDGMESDFDLNAGIRYSATPTAEANYATYNWNFGDGSPEVKGYAPGAPVCETPWLSPCAASVFHSYQYGGTYTVTLTVTDVGGNVATTTQAVTVNGPPPPSPTPPVVAPPGSTPGGTGPGQTPGPGGSGLTAPNPVAVASVISSSLKTVLRKGLVVRYSVNEQVAGHFEVLLDSATAKRLKISGTPAVNLPAGSVPELVIAKAILVTTKGGRSAVRIKFSKRTAARLAHVHKLKLMLRLTVRNATPGTPVSTTVLSSFTLSH